MAKLFYSCLLHAICLIIFSVASTADAAKIARTGPNSVLVRGEIVKGDGQRLKNLLADQPHEIRFYSNGGEVREAIYFAKYIIRSKSKVIIPSGWTCNSACALTLVLLNKFSVTVSRGAYIGVHSPYSPEGFKLSLKAWGEIQDWFISVSGVSPAFVDAIKSTPKHRLTRITPINAQTWKLKWHWVD